MQRLRFLAMMRGMVSDLRRFAKSSQAVARGWPLSQAVVQTVLHFIGATKHHTVAEDLDTRLLIDIDLAILGQAAPLFDAYERHIRQEYAWMPHDAFLEG